MCALIPMFRIRFRSLITQTLTFFKTEVQLNMPPLAATRWVAGNQLISLPLGEGRRAKRAG
jgi:hypothetical protein